MGPHDLSTLLLGLWNKSGLLHSPSAPYLPRPRSLQVSNPDYEKDLEAGLKPKKYKNIVLHGIWGKGVIGKLEPEAFTETRAAVVSMRVLKCVMLQASDLLIM